jgi:hypothetical protein
MTIRSEGATPYRVRSAEDEDLIRQALAILDSRLRTTDDVHVTSPEDTVLPAAASWPSGSARCSACCS